jgi:hypothetical protein
MKMEEWKEIENEIKERGKNGKIDEYREEKMERSLSED